MPPPQAHRMAHRPIRCQFRRMAHGPIRCQPAWMVHGPIRCQIEQTSDGAQTDPWGLHSPIVPSFPGFLASAAASLQHFVLPPSGPRTLVWVVYVFC